MLFNFCIVRNVIFTINQENKFNGFVKRQIKEKKRNKAKKENK